MSKLLIICCLCSFSTFGQRFNEICSGNASGYKNAFLGHVDWLELQNESETTMNLEGYFLTDDLAEPTKWTFPSMVIIAGNYLQITAEENSEYPFAINFPLTLSGGSIYFLNPEEEVLDSLHYPALRKNHSYGRMGEQWYYFDEPTPSNFNGLSTGYNGYASSPTVNRESGLYTPGTHIVLRTESSSDQIMYAINGQPIDAGVEYTSPIVLDQNISLKATCQSDSLIDGVTLYRTYFVEKLHDLPIVNLVLDSLELFDEEDGLYMPGPDASDVPPYMGANFWRNAEISAHFSYFDTSLVLKQSLECDLKIHGGLGSRVNPMKSMQIRAKKFYDQSHFNYSFFEEKGLNQFKRLILRNAGNDYCNACMKDGVLHNYYLKNDLNIDLMAYQPVVLYINGIYWGIHNLREKPDRHYVGTNYGVDSETINLLEHADLDIVEGDNEDFKAIEAYAADNNLGDPVHFNWVAHRIDLESMVDYFLVEFYANNRDWPNFNLKLWNAEGHKWRYLCYDMDVGFRYNAPTQEEAETMTDVLTNLKASNPHVLILTELLENEEFKRYFINRYADLLNTIYQPEAIYEAFDYNKQKVASDMVDHYEKWCGPYEKWLSNFEGVAGFIDGRIGIVRQDISHAFDKPRGVEIKVDNYPSNAGTVRLNSLMLESLPFTGVYFPTNVIDLEAIPSDGMVFDHWENLTTGKIWHSTQIKVNPTSGDQLVAIYRSPESLYHLSVAPNPVRDQLNLDFSMPESSEVLVEIVNLSGKQVFTYNHGERLAKGTQRFELDINTLTSGMYLLYLSSELGRETIQIYKQ